MRLNKYLAHSGLCSRRKAVDLITEGKIMVNKRVETNPAYLIQDADLITFNGKKISLSTNMRYILMNKPKNVITTTVDEKGRKTVMDILNNKIEERIYPVGRLDRNTTGLLLLTNDGELAKRLSHPSYNIKKQYHVVLDRPVSEEDLNKIKKGIRLEDGIARVDDADWIFGSDRSEIGLEIHIGKNRIIRRIFETLGYKVEMLDRVFYAGLTKKNLSKGRFRNLNKTELTSIKKLTKLYSKKK